MKIKIISFFLILFLYFGNTYASLNTVVYQDTIKNYILKYQDDTLKLIRVKKFITKRIGTIEKPFSQRAIESKIIFQYFIDEIEKELKKQESYGVHIPTPQNIKAIYYSAYATSRNDKIDELIQLAKNTEINAVVIDVKETDGYTSFEFPQENFGNILPKSNNRIQNISDIIQKLHENDIYIIGRIVVFKDNYASSTYPNIAIKWKGNHSNVWTDYKGNSYIDPYAKDIWDYHIDIASAAYTLGFDEINFDYVRFPTDGYISDTYYPYANKILSQNSTSGKIQVIEEFSKYITEELKKKYPKIILSADIFGLATHTDMHQIGQNIETFIPYFDYVAPMIYPSHYAKGYLGFSVPDNAPYEIFHDSMIQAKKRIEQLNINSSGALDISYQKIRPWLQGFNCTWCAGATNYDREKFRKQIEALENIGIHSWYVWNASGRYEGDWYNAE